MDPSSLPSEIRQLPVAERILLVEQIWESIIEDEASFELSDAQKQELDHRLEARSRSPDSGLTW